MMEIILRSFIISTVLSGVKSELRWADYSEIETSYPVSPVSATNVSLIDSNEPEVVIELKSGDLEESVFGSPPSYCRCSRQRHCQTSETRIKGQRAVNTPNCLDDEVMCCERSRVACGTITKFPYFHPFPSYGEADFGEYPWTALVLDGRDDVIYGTAVLIAANLALTSARTIQSTKSLRIRVGEWDLASDVEPFEPKEFSILDVMVHPAFDSKTFQNDIAILRLNSSLISDTSPNIRFPCLARPGEDLTFLNARCATAGWASSKNRRIISGRNNLKEVEIQLLQANVCERAIRKAIANPNYFWDETSFICGGGQEGRGLCKGDEGAGLVCEVKGRYILAGMSSWGTSCGEVGFPGVFINLASHFHWIKKQEQRWKP